MCYRQPVGVLCSCGTQRYHVEGWNQTSINTVVEDSIILTSIFVVTHAAGCFANVVNVCA